MGISVRELLLNDYFKDFKLIAGHAGIKKEFQGLTFLEAPDAFRWSQGGEIVCSSGYIISKYEDVIEDAFRNSYLLNTAGLLIKTGRYLNDIPRSMIEQFDEYDIPLITMPFHISWMELIAQTNAAVANRCLTKFQLPTTKPSGMSIKDYKTRKINKILSEIENTMTFPCALFEVEDNSVHYSSSKFRSLTAFHDIKNEQFLTTSLPHTRHTLCDYSQMTRFRLIRDDDGTNPPVSWVRVPILNHETIVAYLVVLEARRMIDYFDEVMIRLAFMNFSNLFESESERDTNSLLSFESLINFAITREEEDKKKLDELLLTYGISSTKEYNLALVSVDSINVGRNLEKIKQVLADSTLHHYAKVVPIDSSSFVLLIDSEKIIKGFEALKTALEQFAKKLEEKFESSKPTIAVCNESSILSNLKALYCKNKKVLDVGKVLLTQRSVVTYDDLGPLVWLDIPETEMNKMLQRYRDIVESPKNSEVLSTLKVYLAHNMNYSITADILNIHINTIRKRIDFANELLDNDLQEPIERMKTIILLEYLDS